VQVRFETVLALADCKSSNASLLGLIAANNSENEWIRAAILSASVECSEAVLRTVVERAPDGDGKTELMNGLIATSLGSDPEQGIVKLIEVLQLEEDRIASWQLEAANTIFDSLARRGISFDQVTAKSNHSAEIELLWNHIERLSAKAGDPEELGQYSVSAIRFIGNARQEQATLAENLTVLFAASYGAEKQFAAVDAIARLNQIDALLNSIESATPSLLRRIESTLVSRKRWTLKLLQHLESKDSGLDFVSPSTRLAIAEHRDPEIRQRVEKLTERTVVSTREEIVEQYQRGKLDWEMATSEQVSRGREVFTKNCATCHKIGELGRNFGPDLLALENKTQDYFLVSILDPNRSIESKYRAYKFMLEDGRTLSGMILEEQGSSIKVAFADGTDMDLLRSEIEEAVLSKLSFMPEGLEKTITPEQMKDLLGFIRASSR
jgi:putative heme-binding domain-containing protein